MRITWLVIAAITCTTAMAHAEPMRMLAPVAESVSIRQAIELDLVLLNDSSEVARVVPQKQLACRIVDERGQVIDGTLSLVNEGTAPVEISAGGFARIRYALVARELRPGRVRVEIEGASTAATIVFTDDAPGIAAATAAPVSAKPVPAFARADPDFQTESGLVEYLAYRFRPHEPMYFLLGPGEPTGKFQFSFKYQVFDSKGSVASAVPGAGNLFFGFTQTSFWDLGEDSSPFFDTSYKPEVLLSFSDIDEWLRDERKERVLPEWIQLDFQAGLLHESNGRSGLESRSLNIVYARPTVTIGDRREWFVSVGPRLWMYVGDLSDNPDIADYRGHAELRIVAGQGGGFQLAATGRLGEGSDQGSLQLDASFPIRELSGKNLDVYFHGQFFTGYGESLLGYNQQDTTYRFGVSLVR